MKILLGVGGSDDSFRALEETIARAEAAGDELTVAVLENPDSSPTPEAVADRVESALAASGLDASVMMLSGHPGSRLVEVAEQQGFDCIVLGGGQRSPLGKVKLGAIAEFVLLNARTTVTLVR